MLEEYERQPACRAICEENPGYEPELVREKQVGHSLCCRAFPRDAEQYVRDALARWLIGGVARGRDDDTSRWRRPCERGGFIMGDCWAAGARAGNSRDVGNWQWLRDRTRVVLSIGIQKSVRVCNRHHSECEKSYT